MMRIIDQNISYRLNEDYHIHNMTSSVPLLGLHVRNQYRVDIEDLFLRLQASGT